MVRMLSELDAREVSSEAVEAKTGRRARAVGRPGRSTRRLLFRRRRGDAMIPLFASASAYAAASYTLTYTAGANGTIVGTSPQTVEEGSDGTEVTAVPNFGYRFVGWSDGSTENPRTDYYVTADVDVTAEFVLTSYYTLTYTAGPNGTIVGVSPQIVEEGSDGTEVTAVPNFGYRFVGWSDGSTENPRTDYYVTADVDVTAEFVLTSYYTLTYTAGPNGTIVGVSPQTVEEGSDGTEVTAVPNTGYHFVGWSDGSTENPRSDYGVTSDVNVTAAFVLTPPPIVTTDLTSGATTAADVAQALVGPGVTISNVTYTGADCALGKFTGGTQPLGFETASCSAAASAQMPLAPTCTPESRTTMRRLETASWPLLLAQMRKTHTMPPSWSSISCPRSSRSTSRRTSSVRMSTTSTSRPATMTLSPSGSTGSTVRWLTSPRRCQSTPSTWTFTVTSIATTTLRGALLRTTPRWTA